MSPQLVLLVNPPSPSGYTADREAASGMGALRRGTVAAQPPHTLAWAGAVLQQEGWPVRALDAVASHAGAAATLAAVGASRAALVVVLASPMTWQTDLDFVNALRQHLPHVRILLIGLATRYLPAGLIEAADMVLQGEPEGAVGRACEQLLASEEKAGVVTPELLGVTGYDPRGHLFDLNHLPPPAWGLFPLHRYPYLPVLASRGCSMGCRYCPVPVTQGSARRVLVAERVAAEIQWLTSRYNARKFRFIDALFGADYEHTVQLCDALKKRGLSRTIAWSCETRPEQVDLSLLQHLSDAGCKEIHLGLESVSPETLRAVRRLSSEQAAQHYLMQVRQLVLGCRAFEISCHVHVMAGLPGDRAGAAATRTFLRAYPPDAIHVTPLMPYPGTSIFPTQLIEEDMRLFEPVPVPRRTQHATLPLWRRAMSRPQRLPTG